MRKPTKTLTKPSPGLVVTERPTKLDRADLVKIVGGCTNENISSVDIK